MEENSELELRKYQEKIKEIIDRIDLALSLMNKEVMQWK